MNKSKQLATADEDKLLSFYPETAHERKLCSALRRLRKEVEKRDKLLDDILGLMKNKLHKKYDGEITIVDQEYSNWIREYWRLNE